MFLWVMSALRIRIVNIEKPQGVLRALNPGALWLSLPLSLGSICTSQKTHPSARCGGVFCISLRSSFVITGTKTGANTALMQPGTSGVLAFSIPCLVPCSELVPTALVCKFCMGQVEDFSWLRPCEPLPSMRFIACKC